MARKTIHFKNKRDYDKWLAYIHEHKLEKHDDARIIIDGKTHRVHHTKTRRGRK